MNILEFLEVEVGHVKMLNDNVAVIKIAQSSASVHRTKHIQLRYFFIRECLENEEFGIEYVVSAENVADQFTKGLRRVNFERMKRVILEDRADLSN